MAKLKPLVVERDSAEATLTDIYIALLELQHQDVDRAGWRDPLVFARDVLGIDCWQTQNDILAALGEPGARVAVKACHASGKTECSAVAALWWTAIGGKTITTAPTWTQVKMLLWEAISRLYEYARQPLGGVLNQTKWDVGADNYAIGISTNEGVRFQGWHGSVLIILDEAAGVRPDIYEAIEGIRAGGDVRILAIGNPVIPSGPFYDAFATNRAGWTTFTIDAFDTPNLTGLTTADLLALSEEELDQNPRPYLTTRRWVKEKLLEWGEDSPAWQSRVRGQFPSQSEDALISLAWLEAAGKPMPDPASTVQPEDRDKPNLDVSVGIDVAGPGESESVLTARCGQVVLAQHWWTKAEVVGDVVAVLKGYGRRLKAVNIDSAGMGYHFATQIRDALDGTAASVHFVNVGEATADPERYTNLKAEAYWALRQRFRDGGVSNLRDPLTVQQLASIRYKHDNRGRVAIETKEQAAKRGVASPDRAESLLLAFMREPANLAAAEVTSAASTGRRPGHSMRW